ncbi:nucleoside diphosphate kinase regulator [Ancylobacter sp. G4_0304]|uniref:nucleoside diphosphate kinase regulator n=1 Tax=Ancylobacter sp. G4_0304 TaxID=3114289 RepID=UPI0039C65EAA
MTTTARRKPAILVTRDDHAQLTKLADSYANSQPELAEELYTELDRARVVATQKAGTGFVRIGSSFRFTTDGGDDRNVTLVLPGEADIAEGKVSVMTPIGVALIGLSAGQSMKWTARDGTVHTLTVVSIEGGETGE